MNLGEIYYNLRKYDEAIAIYNRALVLEPHSASLRIAPAAMVVEAKAEITPLRAVVHTIEAEGPSSAAEVALSSFYLAYYERDPAAAARALAKIPSEYEGLRYPFPHAWYEGLVAKLRQDAPAAHAAFMGARAEARNLSLLNREMRNL